MPAANTPLTDLTMTEVLDVVATSTVPVAASAAVTVTSAPSTVVKAPATNCPDVTAIIRVAEYPEACTVPAAVLAAFTATTVCVAPIVARPVANVPLATATTTIVESLVAA
jgi:hypothetical protein